MMIPLYLGILFFYLFTITPAWADSSVVINELLPNPSSSSDPDWIELYNVSTAMINLSGWKLKDSSATPLKSFGPSDTIDPGKYLVVEVSNRLNNPGDTVQLVSNTDVEIDKYEYKSPTPDTSYGRSPDGSNYWTTFSIPTKGNSNWVISPTPTQSPVSNLYLSEFMANPETGQEWVEIYNDNSSSVSLTGFKIDDQEGASSPFSLPEGSTIGAKSHTYFLFNSIMNNDTDTVRLINPADNVIDSFTYNEPTKGFSWAKYNGSWQQTSSPTPGQENKITLPNTPTTNPTTKATTSPTATKQPTTSKSPTKKPPEENLISVLGATSSADPVKLVFDDASREAKPVVKASNNSKYISWGLIGLGMVIIATPIGLYLKRR